MIADEYEKVNGMGDVGVFYINSQEDVAKIQAHLDGTFIIGAADTVEVSPIKGKFTGKIIGAGSGGVLLTSAPLFAETENAEIKNLRLSLQGSAEREAAYVGFITGKAVNTKFENVRVEGSIAAQGTAGLDVYIGAIAGSIDEKSVITRCSSSAAVTVTKSASLFCGGLVGFNGGVISYSYVHAGIAATSSGEANVGGLAGAVGPAAKIFDSYYTSKASFTAVSDDATLVKFGGIAGKNDGLVGYSYFYAAGADPELTVVVGSGSQDGCLPGDKIASDFGTTINVARDNKELLDKYGEALQNNYWYDVAGKPRLSNNPDPPIYINPDTGKSPALGDEDWW